MTFSPSGSSEETWGPGPWVPRTLKYVQRQRYQNGNLSPGSKKFCSRTRNSETHISIRKCALSPANQKANFADQTPCVSWDSLFLSPTPRGPGREAERGNVPRQSSVSSAPLGVRLAPLGLPFPPALCPCVPKTSHCHQVLNASFLKASALLMLQGTIGIEIRQLWAVSAMGLLLVFFFFLKITK